MSTVWIRQTNIFIVDNLNVVLLLYKNPSAVSGLCVCGFMIHAIIFGENGKTAENGCVCGV